MNRQTHTADIIRNFVQGRFPLARQKAIADDDSLLEEGIIDSLGILEVVTFLESQFHILLSDEEMLADNFETISTLTRFVESKVNSVAGEGQDRKAASGRSVSETPDAALNAAFEDR